MFWIATEDGLNRFVPPGVDQVRKPKSEGQSGRGVRNPTAPGENEDRFFTFTTQHGLGENVVNNIQEDQFGYLWLSGLHGIYRVSRQELNDIAAGRRAQARCVAYGEADGMLNSECNGGDNQPAGCKDSEGRIWFPTVQGVVAVDPKGAQRAELPPPVVIEQVRANDQVVFGDGMDWQSKVQGPKSKVGAASRPNHQSSNSTYQLPPGHARVLEIHYTANSLVAPERMRFKYRLEGHDPDWLWDDQNRRAAFYTDLHPGRYTFRVTACNTHGCWNEDGAQFTFSVAPYLWETWWFYCGAGLSVLLAAAGLHYRRVRGLHKIQLLQQQRALEEERARIARDLHDDLGANLTGLALQLDLAQAHGALPDALQRQLATLARSTRGLVDNMREVVWAMNPQNDNMESLTSFLGQYTENYLAAAGLRCRLEIPAQAPAQALSSNLRHQLFLVLKEALHNVVRHARASEVHLRLEWEKTELRLTLSDNGRGLPPESGRVPEHGLDNMEKRVTKLGGRFRATSGPGGGTSLAVAVPLARGN